MEDGESFYHRWDAWCGWAFLELLVVVPSAIFEVFLSLECCVARDHAMTVVLRNIPPSRYFDQMHNFREAFRRLAAGS